MKLRLLMLVAVLLGLSLTAVAQTSRGTVSGTVADPTGAVIAGANVTLTNAETSVSRTTTANEEGFFRFEAVDSGTYTIIFAAPGFGEVTKTNIPVSANQTADVSTTLAPGGQQVTVDVTADAAALLQTEAPVRGGNIETKRVTELPYSGRNPVALALTLPGVSTNRGSQGVGTFSVNGARGRSNNFLIDGTENNDISVAGQGFQITNPDAIQEVAVQTSNFDAEFGRAGGAVVNVITKSGTNEFHGTVSFLYDTTRDDAISPLQSRNTEVKEKKRNLSATEYIASGTIGGPVVFPFYDGHNRTFFFGAYQQDRARSTSSVNLVTPTAAGRATLTSVFGNSSANLNTYLAATSQTVGVSNPFFIALGTAGTGGGSSTVCPAPAGQRPCVEFGTFSRVYGATYKEPQWQTRLDHKISDRSQLSGRFLWDRQYQPLGGTADFPGFDADFTARYYNFLVSETHIFSSRTTNEARVGYNRILFTFPLSDPEGPAGQLPRITIQGSGASAIGASTTFPQGRIANNYVIQDTVTHVRGDHTLRFGVDYLRQIATQAAPFNPRGSLTYAASTGRTSLANFIEDFGGSGGSANRDFGSGIYFPQLNRIALFAQDRWRATDALTLTLGLRWEDFGTPYNALNTPAFTGLFNVDPVTRTGPFSERNRANHDQNNFGPSFGIAYAPSATGGLMGRLIGEKRTVFRAGFQIGYDQFFNNIASNAQASSPNLVAASTPSTTSDGPRGLPNLSSKFPTTAPPLSALSGQTLIDPRLSNPYYIRWSGGLQRTLPGNMILDLAYVGTRGVHLFLTEDYNPTVPAALRITPPGATTGLSGRRDNLQGGRSVRTNGGESIYHAGQVEVRRRFANNLAFTGAYTWSKFLDNGSEVFGNTIGSNTAFQAIPTAFAPNGLRNERSYSNFDRPHRASFTYVYELPWFREQRGAIGHILGGFQLAGVTTFESGEPFSVFNNVDADAIGGALDRPLRNPINNNVRAVPNVATATVNPCNVAVGATYYLNPEAGNACINPSQAEYVGLLAGSGIFGNAPRNSERTPGINNTNLNITKRTRISENTRLEFRAELYNVFNHPQFVQSPPTILANVFAVTGAGVSSVVTGGVAGRFLNPD
ncbi:MAG: TonB-dependent receptor, partial [Pyrinomonadaceae bacterium]|nr:TonB-dependent receptor [Pyrinomonadaceae bacterium]